MAEKEKKEKKSWGYKDSKTGKKVSAFRDMFDGGGRGGSGASFSTLDHSDYHAAGGKNRDPNPTVSPSGFTRQTQDGRGETLTGFRGMMANPVMGGLLGAFTGGIGGAALGALRPAMGNQIRSNGGLLQTLGLQSKLAPNASMRPQARPAGLGAPQASVGQQSSMQAGPQDFYGLARNPAMNAPLSSIGMGANMQNGYNPSGWLAPYGPNGVLASAATGPQLPPRPEMIQNPTPLPESNERFAPTMPSGMSELRYINYMRNRGIDVDRFPDVVRQEYQNYLNTPSIQGR